MTQHSKMLANKHEWKQKQTKLFKIREFKRIIKKKIIFNK